MPWQKSEKTFYFIGNNLCLDFVNTLIVDNGQSIDLIENFHDLVTWLEKAGILESSKAREVESVWEGKSDAKSLLECALIFRRELHQTVERIIKGKVVSQSVVNHINDLLRAQPGYIELKRIRGGFEKRHQSEFKTARDLLWPIAESACDLLSNLNLQYIKKCENIDCVLVFYDTSKNHSRRWCSMNACGNRMKVAAHYQRTKELK